MNGTRGADLGDAAESAAIVRKTGAAVNVDLWLVFAAGLDLGAADAALSFLLPWTPNTTAPFSVRGMGGIGAGAVIHGLSGFVLPATGQALAGNPGELILARSSGLTFGDPAPNNAQFTNTSPVTIADGTQMAVAVQYWADEPELAGPPWADLSDLEISRERLS